MKKNCLRGMVLLMGFALLFAACKQPTDSDSSPKTFTVSFNTDGGSTVKSQTIAEGGKVSEPATISKTGYTFGGWYKESARTNKWNFETDTVSANITLYAKWNAQQPGTFTVTFSADGGSPARHSKP